jgi:predicted transcriptional regulator
MTVTVKLDAPQEEQLRQHAAATGRTTSDVIRAALAAYLAADVREVQRSPHDLGADLFGRYSADAGLAQQRKRHLAELWQQKLAQR